MILKNYALVPGLKYIPNFITPTQKAQIKTILNSRPWCNQLKRKQQYYGIKYFQTKLPDHVLQPTNSIDHQPLTPFQFIIEQCTNHGFFSPQNPPNQILVNRYVFNDRLGLHVEDVEAFGDVIVGISMGSLDYLRLMSVENKNEFKIELEDCSCYVLQGQARFKWRHGIGRVINNQKYKEQSFERISLTVRHVIDTRRKVPNPNIPDYHQQTKKNQ